MVMMGGSSPEREISLRSGAAILNALQFKGHDACGVDFQIENMAAVLNQLLDFQPDLVFIGLHGCYGEDGTLQGLLEMLNIPYTGSGVASSAICMDKVLTKRFIKDGGFPVAEYRMLQRNTARQPEYLRKLLDEVLPQWGLPVVIKAACQGSSIGTFIVAEITDIEPTIEQCFDFGDRVLLERFVNGREITVPVIGNEHPRVLPLIEVTSQNTFFDYAAKYTSGLCEHIIPAPISQSATEEITRLSAELYRYLDCRGYARIDFILDQQDRPWVLEVNTLPGMTDMSLVPDSARATGIAFGDLMEMIMQYALEQ